MQQYNVPLAGLTGFNAAVDLATKFGGKLDTSEASIRKIPEGHQLSEHAEHMFSILIPDEAVVSFDNFLTLLGFANQLEKVKAINKAA